MSNLKNIAVLLSLSLFACTAPPKTAEPEKPQANYFENTNGCFLLYNMKTNTLDKVIGEERCKERLPACSTFKVPLAVMAFDAKVLRDENQVYKWDGKKDSREEVNRDHNAKTWMRDSVVWFSQRITPKLGSKKLQGYLQKFNYGNQDMKDGLTKAWLISPSEVNSGLRISGYEQLDFMKNLWTSKLPVSERSMQLTREITYLETSPKGFKLSGKTGSNFYDKEHKQHLGWFISHIQKDDQEYITVANLGDIAPTEVKGYGGMRVKEITKKILADQGLW